MGLLDTIFGQSSEIAQTFGGLWFLVGFFLLLFFILILVGIGANADSIVLFSLIMILMLAIDDLFQVPITIYVTIIVFLVLYVSAKLYSWLKTK